MDIIQQPTSPTTYYDALSHESDDEIIPIPPHNSIDGEKEIQEVIHINDILFAVMNHTLQAIIIKDTDIDLHAVPTWILRYYQSYYNERGINKIYQVSQTLCEILSYSPIDQQLVDIMLDFLSNIFHLDPPNFRHMNEFLTDFREVMLCYPEIFKNKPQEFREFLKQKYDHI
jgi:hypothetical protein